GHAPNSDPRCDYLLLLVGLDLDLGRDAIRALILEVHDDLLAALRGEPCDSAARAGHLGAVVVLELLLGTRGGLDRQHLRGGVDARELTTSSLVLRLRGRRTRAGMSPLAL